MLPVKVITKKGMDNLPPITIGSILARLYSSMLQVRHKNNVEIHERQKRFMNEAGCFNSVQLLNQLLKQVKSKNGGVFTQIDVRKAFDTIPHKEIVQRLMEEGIPSHIVAIIRDMYLGISTEIKVDGKDVGIGLDRG